MLNQRNPNPVNEYPIERLYFSMTMFDFGQQEPSNNFETVPIPAGIDISSRFQWNQQTLKDTQKAVTPGNLNL